MILHSAVNREVLCCLTTRCVLTYNVCSLCCRTETRPANLHPLPDFGAGKRVPFQSLPHKKETDRNCSCAVPHRTSDQNLVPKPSHEVEERKQVQTWWRWWPRWFAAGFPVSHPGGRVHQLDPVGRNEQPQSYSVTNSAAAILIKFPLKHNRSAQSFKNSPHMSLPLPSIPSSLKTHRRYTVIRACSNLLLKYRERAT